MWAHLDRLHAARKFTAIIQGGARGADNLAKEWARTKPGIQRFECKAKWEEHGRRAAGPLRNTRMLEWLPNLVVAFPDPDSKGTWDMINKARAAGIETIVFE